ncbi:hypothetical protein GCM10009413_31820 [Tatumella punctata]
MLTSDGAFNHAGYEKKQKLQVKLRPIFALVNSAEVTKIQPILLYILSTPPTCSGYPQFYSQ